MIYELRVRVILYDIKSGEHRNTLSYPIKGVNRTLTELLYIGTAMSYMSCDMGAIDGLEKIRLND